MNYRKIFVVPAALGLLFWIPAGMMAQSQYDEQQRDREMARATIPNHLQPEAERSQKAAEVLRSFTRMRTTGIPKKLLDNAQAIAVIPGVTSAAFIFGGKHGKGVLSVRENGRWQPPVFIDLSGGSWGLQAGVQETDLVLVFPSKATVNTLLSSKLKLGTNASIAAGPVGRDVSAGIALGPNAPIYSYSRTEGVFAGVSLTGSVVTIDDSANHAVYGDHVNAQQIMAGNVSPNPVVMPFLRTVQEVTPGYQGSVR